MYNPARVMKIVEDTAIITDEFVNEAMAYSIACFLKFKTVIPKYRALLYNWETGKYEEYSHANMMMSNNEEISAVYNKLCHERYNYGYPTIFSVLVMPLRATIVNVTTKEEVEEAVMLMFVQSQIKTKHTVFRFFENRMEASEDLTRSIKLTKIMQNLGLIIGRYSTPN